MIQEFLDTFVLVQGWLLDKVVQPRLDVVRLDVHRARATQVLHQGGQLGQAIGSKRPLALERRRHLGQVVA